MSGEQLAESVAGRIAALPWMRSARFDLVFVVGIFALALATGAAVIARPELFFPVLILDMWFLGYHHVIATFTRLCFDRQSFRENRFLVLGLTPLIAAAVLLTVAVAGVWVIVTVYFYWQWWHYTRQSWGIAQVYRAKNPGALHEDGWVGQVVFLAVPVYGILSRSAEGQTRFVGLDLWSVPVPGEVVQLSGYLAAGLLAFWLARRLIAALQGRLAVLHTLYLLTHFVMFMVAYVAARDISTGWLMINIWHNAQYILFVWLYNSRRFRDGVDPEARLLSYVSQPGRLGLYLVTCLAITGVVYWGVIRTLDWVFLTGVAATLVIYQTVNFHHYVVDSLIWKVRRPNMRRTLDLPG